MTEKELWNNYYRAKDSFEKALLAVIPEAKGYDLTIYDDEGICKQTAVGFACEDKETGDR